jgi:hypothetical protein
MSYDSPLRSGGLDLEPMRACRSRSGLARSGLADVKGEAEHLLDEGARGDQKISADAGSVGADGSLGADGKLPLPGRIHSTMF